MSMASSKAPRRQRWLNGFGAMDWRAEERAFAVLLDALTRDRVSAETAEMERLATSRRSLAEVQQEAERVERDELSEARAELDEFHAALADARTRAGADGRGEVAYDSRLPEQDESADMLIQYLVRPGYAEVRTDEPEKGHFVYYLRIDWDRLQALAAERGLTLRL